MTIEAQSESHKEPIGLGGWMIFPILIMVFSPIRIVVGMISDFEGLSPGSFFTLAVSLQVFILLEIFGNILLLVGGIYALYLCFTWNESFPKVFIILLFVNLLLQIIDTAIAAGVFGIEMVVQDNNKDIGRAFLGCLIWIPYMMKSKRVQNTFRPTP